MANTESSRPTTRAAKPVSSESKKPTEKTAPKTAMIAIQPTSRMRPSISCAPTRDHQPASAYRPEDGTTAEDAQEPPDAPGGGGLEYPSVKPGRPDSWRDCSGGGVRGSPELMPGSVLMARTLPPALDEVILADLADGPRGHAHHHGARGDVARHDGACGN